MEVFEKTTHQKLTLLAQIALLMGPFLSMMDSNIVNVAMPDIAHSLNSTLSTTQWIISGYLLALSAVLPASAYLVKRFGTARVYKASLVGFTIGSALCAVAPNIHMLIGARIIQGALGAPLTPLAMIMIFGSGGSHNKSQEIPPVMGILLFLAPAIGPTVGGILLHIFGWYSVFLINVPIGILGFVASFRIPADRLGETGDRAAHFDPLGFVSLAGGLPLALYGASNGPLHGWLSHQSWPFWVAGVVLLLFYFIWGLRHPHPAVEIKLFRSGSTALAVGLCALTSVVMFSIIVIVPVFMENVQQHSALTAGLTLLPQAIVMGMGTVVGNTVATKYGVRRSAMIGMLLMTIGSVLLIFIGENTPAWATALILIFRGLGIGLVIQQLLMLILSGIRPSESADANTLFNVSERFGGAIGVALMSTFLQVRETYHSKQVLIAMQEAQSVQGDLIHTQLTRAVIHGFHDTFWLLAAVAFVGFIATLFLKPAPLGDPSSTPTSNRRPRAEATTETSKRIETRGTAGLDN